VASLLRSNSDAELRANYPFYLLQHNVDEMDWKVRFLFIQTKDMEEKHRVRVQPPVEEEHPFDPAAFERTFYSFRKLSRTGFNYFSVLSNLASAATEGEGSISAGNGDNPAYSPSGNAHWTEIYSDAELTKGKEYQPITISRETWAGWAISQKNLFKIFDAIESRLKNLRQFGVNMPPIHRDTFASTEKLEFYNISTNTIFYPKGVNRIVGALFPKVDPESYQPGFIEKFSSDKMSAGDKQVFDTVVSWVGGPAEYLQLCEKNFNPDGGSGRSTFAVWKGNIYNCLLPWMSQVLMMRRSLPAKSNREGQLEWQTKLMGTLLEQIPLPALMKVAKKDGFFLQIQVNGFRKGDHEAKNSEEQELIASYVSDSIGTADQYAGAGALADLADQTKITNYELGGKFFSGGD
jgi:hypothetical protein